MLATHRVAFRSGARNLVSFKLKHNEGLQLLYRSRSGQIAQVSKQFRRHASTQSVAAAGTSRIVNFLYGTTFVFGLGVVYFYVTDTRASIHRWAIIPAFRWAYPDPEEAHEVGNRSLQQLWTFGLYPRERGDPDQAGDLTVEVFGQTIRNPVGTSAGIDKHADIPDPLFAIGPAIIELGGTTPQPQTGNDKPRVFRLSSQNALINRYGLNSEGADHVAQRLRHRVRHFAEACGFGHDATGETLVLDGHANVPPGSLLPGKLLAVNIAKNKSTPENDIDAVTKDYIYCAERLAPYADILVVNVSSPNTPGLRGLQKQESLTKILSSVVKAARSVQRTTKPAVMVKVSPDEDADDQVAGICQAIWDSDVDGIIVGNTTNKRPTAMPHLKSLSPMEEQHLLETGGFSGPHLYEKTLSMVKKYKKLLGDSPPPSNTPSRSSGAVSKVTADIKSDLNKSDLTSTVDNLAGSPATNRVEHSVQTGAIPTTNMSEKKESEKMPLINIPTTKFYDQPQSEQEKFRSSPDGPESKLSNTPVETTSKASAKKAKAARTEKQSEPTPDKSSPDLARRDRPKVIFATGGITNGKQALEILNAGASVAMVYTALVYGGVGTVSRIKDEMRQEMKKQGKKKQKKIASS